MFLMCLEMWSLHTVVYSVQNETRVNIWSRARESDVVGEGVRDSEIL